MNSKSHDVAVTTNIAIALWNRFSPSHHTRWEKETHKFPYLDAAREAMDRCLRESKWMHDLLQRTATAAGLHGGDDLTRKLVPAIEELRSKALAAYDPARVVADTVCRTAMPEVTEAMIDAARAAYFDVAEPKDAFTDHTPMRAAIVAAIAAYDPAKAVGWQPIETAIPEGDMHRALEWMRDRHAPSSYLDAIEEAVAAYDPARVGADTVNRSAPKPVAECSARIAQLEHALREAMDWNWLDDDARPSEKATLCDAALASHSPPKVDTWQPIATAPKDGLPRLYFCHGKVLQAFVDATGVLTVQHEFGWRAMRRKPTHWMPLPPPPVLGANEGAKP